MSSDPTTWADLQTSVGAWTNEDFTTAQIKEFIAFGERALQRLVFTPDRESALSITADAQSETLPTDFWGFKSGPYVDGTTDSPLVRMTPELLRSTYPTNATGTPVNFAIEGENILFGPIPSSSAIKGTYYATIPILGDSQATNWLLTDHPDAYLAAALIEGFAFNMDEARVQFWGNRLAMKVEEINRAGARRSSNSGPLVASTSIGNVPNILA